MKLPVYIGIKDIKELDAKLYSKQIGMLYRFLTDLNNGAISWDNISLDSFTTGSVLFIGSASAISQNNGQFFWDNTNNRLGIGTASPTQVFEVATANIGGQIGLRDSNTGSAAKINFGKDNTFSNSFVVGRFNGSATGTTFGYPRADLAVLDQSSVGDIAIGTEGAYIVLFATNNVEAARFNSSQNLLLKKTISNYNGINTAGQGIPSIYGFGRSTAQTAAVTSVATYTVGAADGSFMVSGNVLVTASVTHSFNLQVTYTDEGGTARTVTMNVQQLGGTLVTSITNVTGVGPYEGVPLHIRCKASTAITVLTAGTFTSVTYNVEGVITQIA